VFDTHCHLDQAAFDADRAEVVARARAAGVTDLLVPGVGPDGWAGLLELARTTPGLHAGLGIHPQLLPALSAAGDDDRLAALEAALGRGGAVAVGECGLDGPAARAGAPLDRPRAVLAGQLERARRFYLPVALHCLRAHDALLDLLERDGLPAAGGVLHSFSGSAEQVAPFARLGLHFAFAGSVTWERARRPLLAARAVPPDRLLLETDAPSQTPRPHHGRCEPAHLAEIATALAAALGLTPTALDELTSANARRLFRLAPPAAARPGTPPASAAP
jgi:TatD DNase family protein